MPRKVLVADDSLSVQKELTQLLKDAGVEVVAVSNGEHAVRKLADINPDLVLADVFMPVRSGYEVCLYIKANPRFAHIPVLLLVSKLEPYDEKEAARVCADGKLEKPFANPQATKSTLLEVLDKPRETPAVTVEEEPPAASPVAPEPLRKASPAPTAKPEPLPEANPELETENFEQFGTQQPVVTFEPSDQPLSFVDMEESSPPGSKPPTGTPTATRSPGETSPKKEGPKREDEFIRPHDSSSEEGEDTVVVKPELADAWEMTGPQPGAPEIPTTEKWETQWEIDEDETPTTEKLEAAPQEESPPLKPSTPAPSKKTPTQPYGAEEFSEAFAKAQDLARKTIYSLPASQQLDPQAVEKVVEEVLARLSPQLMETIARELVRPLAESLLKEKLKP